MFDDGIHIATIESTTLSIRDHGCLSARLHLKYLDDSVQSFGDYALFIPGRGKKQPPQRKNFGGYFIWRVLEVTEANSWESLRGMSIRVNSFKGHIEAIGHAEKDLWFWPGQEFLDLEHGTLVTLEDQD